ncbi:MAG: outer membrane protein assembly factor BamD [Ignavibacteriales bacterium]|nr:MAG: outer membrane protein assembly factor BamD [Ignavibacteriales bacterium]
MNKIFQLLVLSLIMFFSCGKTSDKEYTQMAEENIKEGNTSEAILNYQKVLDEYPESKIIPKVLAEQASLYQENGNISEAILNYQKIAEEYPESDLAPEAIVKQASLYHENKVKNINRIESFETAANLFLTVSEKYPESEQAPSSLFMAGFIFANDIQDFTRAKAVYNMFLNKYPGDELASSAKEELEYMGLTPEEILRKKTSQGSE